jgi:hypothetical protein
MEIQEGFKNKLNPRNGSGRGGEEGGCLVEFADEVGRISDDQQRVLRICRESMVLVVNPTRWGVGHARYPLARPAVVEGQSHWSEPGLLGLTMAKLPMNVPARTVRVVGHCLLPLGISATYDTFPRSSASAYPKAKMIPEKSLTHRIATIRRPVASGGPSFLKSSLLALQGEYIFPPLTGLQQVDSMTLSGTKGFGRGSCIPVKAEARGQIVAPARAGYTWKESCLQVGVLTCRCFGKVPEHSVPGTKIMGGREEP